MKKEIVIGAIIIAISLLGVEVIKSLSIRYNILEKRTFIEECISEANNMQFESMKNSGYCKKSEGETWECTHDAGANPFLDDYKQDLSECSLIYK